MSAVANCPSCGSKIRAGRDRCPKCRAWLVERDPAAAARRGRQLAAWSAGLLGGFLLIVGGLWLASDKGVSATGSTVRPADPLASRRRPRPPAGEADASSASANERPFLDSAGAGAVAYSSGDYASALEQYQAAVVRNPQDAESLSNLGQVLVRLGRAQEAMPYFERALDLIPDRWAYRFNYARALGVLGRWDESIASYRQAQRLFPNDHVTTFNLALALHKKGDDAAAVEEYQKATSLAPDDAAVRFGLALSYERLQKNAEAAAAYQEYLRLAPQAGDADQVRARIVQLTSHEGQAP